ncbi:histidine phosphatase family protein [Vibrio sp.]|uniref:histidine phosphatase family protein n=1 Tax=Vibrio sp. TaxID=678 RepID=UPI003D1440C9
MYSIYLLRHGNTLGPAALNGRTDVGVADKTQQLMAKQLESLPFTTVVTSPLRRCADLSVQLKALRPELKVIIEPAFQELDFGEFDGRTFDELSQQWPLLEAFWQDPAQHILPGAEPLSQAYHRVSHAWQWWVNQCNENCLMILHGGTIRLLLANILQVNWQNPRWYSSLSIANQSITQLTVFPGEPPLVKVNNIGVALSANRHHR